MVEINSDMITGWCWWRQLDGRCQACSFYVRRHKAGRQLQQKLPAGWKFFKILIFQLGLQKIDEIYGVDLCVGNRLPLLQVKWNWSASGNVMISATFKRNFLQTMKFIISRSQPLPVREVRWTSWILGHQSNTSLLIIFPLWTIVHIRMVSGDQYFHHHYRPIRKERSGIFTGRKTFFDLEYNL